MQLALHKGNNFAAGPMVDHGRTISHLDAVMVAGYLDGRLPPAERTNVETHLADCNSCRAEVVQLEAIVRPPRTGRRVLILGVAAAAAVVLLALPRQGSVGTQSGDPDSVAQAIVALGSVAQPPVYLGVAVRAPTAGATEQFEAGMRAYSETRYAEAVAALRSARAGGVEGAGAPFFLGASLLMSGEANAAADEFARVVSLGDTPYLGESHYYRAKALLRLSQAGDAVAELDRAIEVTSEPLRSSVQALRDSVRALRAR